MFIKVGLSPHIYVRQFIFEHLLIHRPNDTFDIKHYSTHTSIESFQKIEES